VNVYNYFFYRLYCCASQWKNDVAPPEFKAFAIISVLVLGYAIFFAQLIELIFGFRIIARLPTYGVYAAVILSLRDYLETALRTGANAYARGSLKGKKDEMRG
jgi:hypothetical protein